MTLANDNLTDESELRRAAALVGRDLLGKKAFSTQMLGSGTNVSRDP